MDIFCNIGTAIKVKWVSNLNFELDCLLLYTKSTFAVIRRTQTSYTSSEGKSSADNFRSKYWKGWNTTQLEPRSIIFSSANSLEETK